MDYRPYVLRVQEVSVEVIDLLESGVSGETLARMLNVSRTSIWKFIKNLEKIGYVVERRRGLGYKIIKSPDLSPYEVARVCKNSKIIDEVYYYKVVDSTNQRAKELAKPNVLFVAERQLKGRGRYGRSWISEEGGLYFTITLPSLLPMEDVPKVTLATGVAMARVLGGRIKWPNDVLCNGKKVCGILCELVGSVEKPLVIVGIGINVNNETPEEGISLKEIYGKEFNRSEILAKALESFEKYYLRLIDDEWDLIRKEWKELSDTLGRYVRIKTLKGVYEGYALDIDRDGGLILKNGVKVFSGDCFYLM